MPLLSNAIVQPASELVLNCGYALLCSLRFVFNHGDGIQQGTNATGLYPVGESRYVLRVGLRDLWKVTIDKRLSMLAHVAHISSRAVAREA